jgi:DNA/RNA endonuclease YhcR with UshA esterase domain
VRDQLLGVLLAVGLLVFSFPLSIPLVAHHSVATIDTTKEITLKGTVTAWRWANPHCILTFDVRDDTGTVRSWAAETANPTSMTQRGWSRTSLKAGDEITVTVQPARNGEPVGILMTAAFSDGRKLVAGLPGTPRPVP